MNLKLKALTKSPWVFHLSCGSCNNCDIEILDALTPRFDLERFGVLLVGSIRHADAILVTGAMNRKSAKRLKALYAQAPKPCVVVAIGECAISKGIFSPSYNCVEDVDKAVPVSAYIPGCPPKPEAILSGVVKLLGKLRG